MAKLEVYDNNLVTVGKPATGGACFTSFAAKPTLPTDATTKMGTLGDFVSLGDFSDGGYSMGKSVDNAKFKSWRGSTVLSVLNSVDYTLKAEFIEVNRVAVAQLRFGKGNVEAGEDGSVAKIKAALGGVEYIPLVIDELESNGYLRRTVIPRAVIESFDDEPHQSGALMVYGMTFTILDPGDGVAYYIYRAKPVSV